MVARNERDCTEFRPQQSRLEGGADTLSLRMMKITMIRGSSAAKASMIDPVRSVLPSSIRNDLKIVEQIAGKRQDTINGFRNLVLFIKGRHDDTQPSVWSG